MLDNQAIDQPVELARGDMVVFDQQDRGILAGIESDNITRAGVGDFGDGLIDDNHHGPAAHCSPLSLPEDNPKSGQREAGFVQQACHTMDRSPSDRRHENQASQQLDERLTSHSSTEAGNHAIVCGSIALKHYAIPTCHVASRVHDLRTDPLPMPLVVRFRLRRLR